MHKAIRGSCHDHLTTTILLIETTNMHLWGNHLLVLKAWNFLLLLESAFVHLKFKIWWTVQVHPPFISESVVLEYKLCVKQQRWGTNKDYPACCAHRDYNLTMLHAAEPGWIFECVAAWRPSTPRIRQVCGCKSCSWFNYYHLCGIKLYMNDELG